MMQRLHFNFLKRLNLCVRVNSVHLEHLLSTLLFYKSNQSTSDDPQCSNDAFLEIDMYS